MITCCLLLVIAALAYGWNRTVDKVVEAKIAHEAALSVADWKIACQHRWRRDAEERAEQAEADVFAIADERDRARALAADLFREEDAAMRAEARAAKAANYWCQDANRAARDELNYWRDVVGHALLDLPHTRRNKLTRDRLEKAMGALVCDPPAVSDPIRAVIP